MRARLRQRLARADSDRALRQLAHQTGQWLLETARPGQLAVLFGGLRGEPDLPGLWLGRLRDAGLRVALFRLAAGPGLMEAVEVEAVEELTRGNLGQWEGPPQRPAMDPLRVDLALVPGLGFCPRTGARLGRGGGYYDRYLRRLRPSVPRAGVTLRSQLAGGIPMEPHDVPVGLLITEDGVTHPG
jgi:5-formyltetrahydrofolate cyclo-ligase